MRKISRKEFCSLLNREQITLEEDLYVKETIYDKILLYLQEENLFNQTIHLTGTFNGNGHTIHNTFSELFYEIGENAVVKNLTISDVNCNSESVLCKKNNGKIKDVTIKDCSIEEERCGGITKVNFGEISGCEIEGTITADKSCGGVAEFNNGVIENCDVNAIITGNAQVGGVNGWNIGEVHGCTFSGKIIGSTCFGGIVGLNETNTIYDCSVTDSLIRSDGEFSGINGGGICGINRGELLECNYDKSKVKCNEKCGGLCGTNNGLVENNYTYSIVEGGCTTGGLVGRNNSRLKNCISKGIVKGDAGTGVFTGELGDDSEISSVISDMEIKNTLPGCCLGNIAIQGSVENCYYYCDNKSDKLTTYEQDVITYIPNTSEEKIKALAKL